MAAMQETNGQAVDDWRASSDRLSSGSGRLSRSDPSNLADLLERILDKGIVIVGDISISLVDIELLTIRLRLLIASVDKAREMGINWWESDPWLSRQAQEKSEADSVGRSDRSDSPEIEDRFDRLERAVSRLADALEPSRAESVGAQRGKDR